MKTKEQVLPEWFQGSVYNSGATVTNIFSGEQYELNNIEVSMYDFIMGCNYLMERQAASIKIQKEFSKGLTWFRRANPEAYMVLLD